MLAVKPKNLPSPENRRLSQRRVLNRVVKIQFVSGGLPRDCLITDIPDGGVRLHVEGFEVPEEFVLLLTGDDITAKERAYKVVWRLGYEVGARFLGHVRRGGVPASG
jgi:hypothetical protein